MAIKNPYQLTQLAYDAGFRKDEVELTRAVAAAIGESGGNTRARGDGGQSYGLWQIHLPSHPEYAKNPEALFDERTNADAAYKIYVDAGRSFEPFHAFSHANALRRAQLVGLATLGVKPWKLAHPAAGFGIEVKTAGEVAAKATGVEGIGEAVGKLTDAVGKAGAWMSTPANVGRLVLAVGGVVIVVGGIMVLMRPAAETALKTAAAVKP